MAAMALEWVSLVSLGLVFFGGVSVSVAAVAGGAPLVEVSAAMIRFGLRAQAEKKTQLLCRLAS